MGDKDSTDLCKMRKVRTMQEFFKEELIYLAVMYSEIVYSFIFFYFLFFKILFIYLFLVVLGLRFCVR